LGYNAYPSPVGAPYPIGHWPWYANGWLAAKAGPVAEMTWLDNGRGAYADYPYLGALPDYPSGSPPVPPAPIDIPVNAFRGLYYSDEAFTNLTIQRLDAGINFNWGMGSPDPSIAPDSFSVRWEGYWDFAQTGIYRFTVTADDGIRVWVDNASILDAWLIEPATTYVQNSAVASGRHYLRVDFFEHTGQAVAQVAWSYELPPHASFVYSPSNPRTADTVRFDGSLSTGDRGVVYYLWDFGDGNRASGNVTTHAYSTEGAYNVTLTVQDADGATGTVRAQLFVIAIAPLWLSPWELVGVLVGVAVALCVRMAARHRRARHMLRSLAVLGDLIAPQGTLVVAPIGPPTRGLR
jgi:hypothetical protein